MKYNYEELIENINEGVYFFDTNRRITYWNKAAEMITGYSSDEVMGSCCSDNILTHVDEKGKSVCRGMCPLAQTARNGVSQEAELYLHHKDGYRIPVTVRSAPLKYVDGSIAGGAELFVDNSAKSVMLHRIEELKELALMDSLTGLCNRRYLDSELNSRLQETGRYGLLFGVLFLDIDNFKDINDTYGHDVGDKVLKTVANTLLNIARPFDLFGRWGGEEFLGVIRNINSDGLVQVGERCRTQIEHSYFWDSDNKISVTVSIGATMVKEGDTINSLVARSDSLMYESKKNGRDRLTMD